MPRALLPFRGGFVGCDAPRRRMLRRSFTHSGLRACADPTLPWGGSGRVRGYPRSWSFRMRLRCPPSTTRPSPPRNWRTPSRRRSRPVDLSGYAVEDWAVLRHLLGDDARRLPPVLHPLRPQRLVRLDGGDRDLLPRRDRLPRLGHVRAHEPPHPGRLPLPLPAARPQAGCWRRRSTSSASPSSPTRAILVWRFMAIIEGEEMTTIRVPKNLFYGAVFIGFCSDVRPLRPGRDRQLAARLLRPRAARRLRRAPAGRDLMLILLGSFLVLMILGLPVALAMAVSSLLFILATRHGAGRDRRPAHDRRRRELSRFSPCRSSSSPAT